jgi:hypothetical protein
VNLVSVTMEMLGGNEPYTSLQPTHPPI